MRLIRLFFQNNNNYNILQNSQSFTFREYCVDIVNESESESESNNKFIKFIFASIVLLFISISRLYKSSLSNCRFQLLFETLFYKLVKQLEKKNAISLSIYLALSLYFERYKNLQTKYVKLREILLLLLRSRKSSINKENTNSIYLLLLKLDTLKRQIRQQISLLQLIRKTLSITIEKQSLLIVRQKNQTRKQIIYCIS